MRLVDRNTDQETGSRAEGGRVEDFFSLRLTRMDGIKNEHIGGTAGIRRAGDKVREARLTH